MNVATTSFTVAEYCDQMRKGSIVVNREYQRSPGIWPAAARSYLIDTILLGFPIPKIALFQKTDVKSRKTIKEIVDGQQRSMAIVDYFEGKLRITGQSEFAGKRFEDLDLDKKRAFLEYPISTDLFVGATEGDIRQMFRRMNSYTVPLNPEEHRHATHQGEFKWFIVDVTEAHANALKEMGVFSETSLARMQDAKLFTEVVYAYENGIETYTKAKLNKLYSNYDDKFPSRKDVRSLLDDCMDHSLKWTSIHGTSLMKAYSMYSLMLAIAHVLRPSASLRTVVSRSGARRIDKDVAEAGLSTLLNVMDADDEADVPSKYRAYFAACSKGTNTKVHREVRFTWLCKAITGQL